MRSGQAISIDFAAAMTIFLFMVAAGVYILQTAVLPGSGFSSPIQSAGIHALDTFLDESQWTVQEMPVFIRSQQQLQGEPVSVTVPLPTDVVEESVLVTVDGNEIPSQYNVSTNETVFVTDLDPGLNRANLVYTREVPLPDRAYSLDLDTHQSSAWNQDVNTTFLSTGLSRLRYKDLEMLESAADLGVSSSPVLEQEVVRVNVSYPDTWVQLYHRSGKIPIRKRFTGEETLLFNLSSNFTELYGDAAGSIYDLDKSGVIYDNTTDFVDFSAVRGLGIMGEDLVVRVSRDSPSSRIEVRINVSAVNGGKTVLLYAHDGNYTNAVDQKQAFFDPAVVRVGMPVPISGVSTERADALGRLRYDELQTLLGLDGLQYNISVGGVFNAGLNVSTDTTVTAMDFPVPVLHRFGNATREDFALRVWNR